MTFKVFGKTVKFEFVDGLMSEGYEAIFDPNSWEIKIDKQAERPLQCCIHELGHSSFERIGLHQTKLPSEIEEIFVDSMATLIEENFEQLVKIWKMQKKRSGKK